MHPWLMQGLRRMTVHMMRARRMGSIQKLQAATATAQHRNHLCCLSVRHWVAQPPGLGSAPCHRLSSPLL